MLGVAERVAGDGMPQADDADDVAGGGRVDLGATIRLDLPKLRDVFLLVFSRVVDPRVRLQVARIHPNVMQVAVPVGLNLEDQSTERLRDVGFARRFAVLVLRIGSLDRRHVGRAGEIPRHAVHDRLDANPIQRRAAEQRDCHVVKRRVAQHAVDQLGRNGLLGQHQFGQLVAIQGELIEHVAAPHLGVVEHVGRNLVDEDVGALALGRKNELLHLHQIDHAAKGVLDVGRSSADRKRDDDGIRLEPFLYLVDGGIEIGSLAVHLVDEREPRHVVFVGLTPNGFALGFDALAGAKHNHAAIEHPQTPLDLGGEIDVAGRVDQIDADVFVRQRDTRRVDRNAAFLLLGVEVGDRRALVDRAHPMTDAAIEQHPLGDRRFAGVDVGDDADVAELFEF